MNNPFNADFLEFLELLKKHEVTFLLVGGYAVILHGYVRSTGDMDLWVEPTAVNYKKLEKVYFDFGAPIFTEKEFLNQEFDVWSIGNEPIKIEILSSVKGLLFSESYKEKAVFKVGKLEIPFINFKDLIKAKQAVSRYKDLADIEQLTKIKE